MTEQKIQVGDKVRITYEGVVTDVNKYNEPMIDGGQYFYTDASRPLVEKYAAGKVEILEKRKPQVGDVIPKHSHPSVFDALPVGTLLDINNSTGSDRSEVFLKTPAGWIYSETGKPYLAAHMSASRRVVYIP